MNLKKVVIFSSVTIIALLVLILLKLQFSSPGNRLNEAQATNNIEDAHAGHDHNDPSLESQSLDWCAEHQVPESQCTLCHADLIDSFKAKNDWCAEHGIPESHCRLCNPGIQFPQAIHLVNQEIDFDIKSDEIEISLFFRKNSPVCATNDALIQFASSETVDRAGLTVHKTRSANLSGTIEAPAETAFDESKFTVVTTSVFASVTRWLISPGDQVNAGDVLAILNSPVIAEMQAKLITANAECIVQQKELKRHHELKDRNLISEIDFEQQAAMTQKSIAENKSAKGFLLSAGMKESDIENLITSGQVSSQLLLRATENGTVVERTAKLGELLEAGSSYAVLADIGAMWIEAHLPEQQLRLVSIGQKLTFATDGRGLNQVGGEIIWVSQYLDPHTYTGVVRAKVVDPSHMLKAGEFGRVKIYSSAENEVTLVPKNAVQWEGCCNVVFVKETEARYRPRKVNLVESSGPYYQITNGITPGEEVVVNGAFLLKTELKKSSIGAGCCGIELAG